jgi:hypothetical protein
MASYGKGPLRKSVGVATPGTPFGVFTPAFTPSLRALLPLVP